VTNLDLKITEKTIDRNVDALAGLCKSDKFDTVMIPEPDDQDSQSYVVQHNRYVVMKTQIDACHAVAYYTLMRTHC
jgi:hypothetical protein